MRKTISTLIGVVTIFVTSCDGFNFAASNMFSQVCSLVGIKDVAFVAIVEYIKKNPDSVQSFQFVAVKLRDLSELSEISKADVLSKVELMILDLNYKHKAEVLVLARGIINSAFDTESIDIGNKKQLLLDLADAIEEAFMIADAVPVTVTK